MTDREKQIFEIIRENPAIGQSELAARLGITRSSVAVHVANLQKKGYLLGKGYIINDGVYVVGVGAANVDVHCKSRKPLVARDSNPGFISFSAGGVTRNVCENLARLGMPVKLITAVGEDVFAAKIREDSAAAGVDVSNLYVCPSAVSSTYVSVLDDGGDMAIAVSDMRILETLPADFLAARQQLICGAAAVCCDPSLPLERMEQLLDIARCPVYVDPVSTAYAKKMCEISGRFHTIKPNRLEAEILSGIAITDDKTLLAACETILRKGTRRVIVTLGAKGCMYADDSGLVIRRSLRPVEHMANATGGGDAFTAGVIFSTLSGKTPDLLCDFALAAGNAAVSAETTINPNMSEALVNKILKEYKNTDEHSEIS